MFNYTPYLKSLAQYMEKNGFTEKPFPKVVLNNSVQDDDVFIKTGYYDYENKKVVLFVNGRHPKDVLRSFAHEMIHHKQNLDGRLNENSVRSQEILNDDVLQKLEEEAYLKGNISFRKWTEEEKKKG